MPMEGPKNSAATCSTDSLVCRVETWLTTSSKPKHRDWSATETAAATCLEDPAEMTDCMSSLATMMEETSVVEPCVPEPVCIGEGLFNAEPPQGSASSHGS